MSNVLKMCEADTLFMIECMHSYECLWNVSVADYHKKEVRHAALRSISIRLAEDRQKIILTGELKFCFQVVYILQCSLTVTLSLAVKVLSCVPFIHHVAVLVLVLYVHQCLYPYDGLRSLF